MTKTIRVVLLLALALGVMQVVVAEETAQPTGAKALFGQGNEDAFFPRGAGSSGSSEKMDPTSQVSETMLTSFYKKPDFPGIAYSLELIRAGETTVRTVTDPRTHEFHNGDRIRVRLVPNFTGHAYVMQAKGGNSSLVYPANFGTAENQVVAGRETYVPTSGWLKLTDPAEPFTMRVLFKPGAVDYRLNQPSPNPAAARVALAEAVNREWQTMAGSKALVFEADNSYVNASAGPPPQMPQQQVQQQMPQQQMPQQQVQQPMPQQQMPQQQMAGGGQGMAPQAMPAVNRSQYTTNYVVVDPNQWATSAPPSSEPAIAIEVPIKHVGR